MSLNELKNNQKLMDVLDGLGLSAENRKIAEAYFDGSGEADGTLLSRLTMQDLSQLPEKERTKSVEYVIHLRKRGRNQELARYIKFIVSAGGSTANRLMVRYGWNLNEVRECLSPEQTAALQAESIAENGFTLSWQHFRLLNQTISGDFDAARRAMKLCCRGNSKVLLAALYLNGKKGEEADKGVLKRILSSAFSPESAAERETVEYLRNTLTENLPNIFTPALMEEEKKAVKDYVKKGIPQRPFPSGLLSMLEGKTISGYFQTLLSGSAFLALPYSGSFLALLQVTAAADPEGTMKACRQMSEESWFQQYSPQLEQSLPVSRSFFLQWYSKNRVDEGLQRMIGCAPELVLEEAMKPSITTSDYQYIAKQVEQKDPKLYRQMNAAVSDSYRQKAAAEQTESLTMGQTEAKQYLLGEVSLEQLYPFVNSWRGAPGYYTRYTQADKLLEFGWKDYPQLCRRTIVLAALRMAGSFFTYCYLTNKKDADQYKKKLMELVEIFDQEGVPIQYQADAMEGIYSAYYLEADKNHFLDAAVEALSSSLPGHREEFYQALKNSTAIGRGICLRVLDTDGAREKKAILACAMDNSRQVRNTLVLICTGHPEWEPELRAFLTSGKAQERETAILVMKNWGVSHYRKELEEALEKEKSKKLKALLQECLGVSAWGIEGTAEGGQAAGNPAVGNPAAGKQAAEKLAAEILKGGKKRKVAWAYETPFSPVHRKDGSLASEEYLQAILVAYADMPVPGVNPEARKLSGELEEKELGQYVRELFDKWMEGGAEAKKKWVLYAAAIHGGEEAVPLFYRQIQDWPQHARGALAAEAVKALALNGSAEALLLVDQISRKFKFRQVKTAAAQALDYAASSLGLSRAELEDRIVPTLGFDENLRRTFDYGDRSFSVYLTPALELEIFDGEEKRLKNMPAPGKKDDEKKAAEAYAEFKQMKKQLKTVAANQKLRMEQALSAERLWKAGQWKALFVKNPVMHQFAIGLIWGVYEEGALKDTFRYMEDGSFNTADEEEFAFPEEGLIGLVHPIELSGEERDTWKEQLEDYEVAQPIEQLERPVYQLTEQERGARELTRFGGKLLNGLSLSGKLQGMGWYRGSVVDGGFYTTFYREDGAMGVELEFSGCGIGDENEEVTVYGAVFYRAGTVSRGSYVYDAPKPENQYTLDAISPRYFSEIVLQLTRATVSSKEQLPYPDCRR